MYHTLIFLEHILDGSPIDDEIIDVSKVEAFTYTISNARLRIALLYNLNIYYANYCINNQKCYEIQSSITTFENDETASKSIYYKYMKTLYYNNIDQTKDIAIIYANNWVTTESTIYGKYLSLKAYEITIHGESAKSLPLLAEAEEVIDNNESYFNDMEIGHIYHQMGSHLLLCGNIVDGLKYLNSSINCENIMSQLSATLLFLMLVHEDGIYYRNYQEILKSMKYTVKSTNIKLLVKCFTLLYVDKNYEAVEQLILNDLFDNFIIDRRLTMLSNSFKSILNYCLSYTNNLEPSSEYFQKEYELFYKNKNKRTTKQPIRC